MISLRQFSLPIFFKFASLAISVLIHIWIARKIGIYGVGIISLATTALNIALKFTLFGFEQSTIRNISTRKSDRNPTINYFLDAVLLTSCLSLIVTLFIALYIQSSQNFSADVVTLLSILLYILPLITLKTLGDATLIGLGYNAQNIFVTTILHQTVYGLVLLVAYLNSEEMTAEIVLYSMLLAYIICFFYTWIYLYFNNAIERLFFPFTLTKGLREKLNILSKNFNFFFISIFSVLFFSLDKLMLGILTSAENVGLYTVAFRVASLLSLSLVIANALISNKVASLYAEGNRKKLEKLVHRTTILCLLVTLPLFIIILVFPKQILSLWGEEFLGGTSCLIFLAFSHIINVLTGCIGILLNMTKNEKYVTYHLIVFTGVNFLLNWILIPLYGASGAALATGITTASMNVSLCYLVYRRLAITAFSFRALRNLVAS